MEKIITPENLNRVGQANKEINDFVNMLKDDSTTFSHLDMSYLPLLQKYYPEVVSTVIDIRVIYDDIIDVELNSGIITLAKDETEDKEYRYHIVNDICLAKSAEIETKSGYTEDMTIEKLMHGGYHLVFER